MVAHIGHATGVLLLDLITQQRLAVRRQVAPIDIQESSIQRPKEIEGAVATSRDRATVRLDRSETIELIRCIDSSSEQHPFTGWAQIAKITYAGGTAGRGGVAVRTSSRRIQAHALTVRRIRHPLSRRIAVGGWIW